MMIDEDDDIECPLYLTTCNLSLQFLLFSFNSLHIFLFVLYILFPFLSFSLAISFYKRKEKKRTNK